MQFAACFKKKGWCRVFYGFLVLICFSCLLSAAPIKKNDVPPLMESIRFNKTIRYCDVEIPLHQDDVKTRLEKEMLLALWDRPQVILWIKRANRYFFHIEKILKENQLPLDLKYVPVIESALRPHAGSSKGAVGYWQFLKSTGRSNGLTINTQIDERRNIFESTRAAARYLNKLHKTFGSYLLAVAAFNMGEYGLKTEIDAQNTSDYFSLYLPLETQRYVFKLVSAKLILENLEDYGFSYKKSDLYPRLEFDRVNLKTRIQIPVLLVANAAGVPFKKIKDLNPELRGYYIKEGTTSLMIPKGTAKGFKSSFTSHYSQWESQNHRLIHIVREGENLTGIAKKYGVSLSLLMKLNHLSKKRVIHPGDRLIVK